MLFSCPPATKAQELKPDTPKMDKMPEPETLKGGVQHNRVTEKKKTTKLKAKTRKSRFKGRKARGGRADTKRLRSSVDNNLLESTAKRGIGIIGVRFVAMEGYPPVINTVFPGTPAYEKGLAPDDVIVAVDGVPTMGLTRDECYDLIVGTPNTPVTLSLRRGGSFIFRTMVRMDFTELTNPHVRNAYGFNL